MKIQVSLAFVRQMLLKDALFAKHFSKFDTPSNQKEFVHQLATLTISKHEKRYFLSGNEADIAQYVKDIKHGKMMPSLSLISKLKSTKYKALPDGFDLSKMTSNELIEIINALNDKLITAQKTIFEIKELVK